MVKQNICQNCGDTFPNHIYINGERKLLTQRKYCLECSPYGLHNTKILEDWKSNGLKCIVCNTDLKGRQEKYCSKKCKSIDFYNKNSEDIINNVKSNVKNRRYKHKLMAIEYLGGSCSRCGYNGNVECFAFHHKDPNTKKFQISIMLSHSWNNIKKELDKCELLCGNCHMIIHHNNIGVDSARNRHNHKYKKRAIDYLGGKCSKCGYDKHYVALCFHHKNGEDKEFQIGNSFHLAWDTIQSELDKCTLLCINCHRIIHNQ